MAGVEIINGYICSEACAQYYFRFHSPYYFVSDTYSIRRKGKDVEELVVHRMSHGAIICSVRNTHNLLQYSKSAR